MKRDARYSLADQLEDQIGLWAAEVEVARVKYQFTPETSIEFSNEIDAWNKMEFMFREQIKRLRQDKNNKLKSGQQKELKDLESLYYSIRQRLE